jgi:hypothetical protein
LFPIGYHFIILTIESVVKECTALHSKCRTLGGLILEGGCTVMVLGSLNVHPFNWIYPNLHLEILKKTSIKISGNLSSKKVPPRSVYNITVITLVSGKYREKLWNVMWSSVSILPDLFSLMSLSL